MDLSDVITGGFTVADRRLWMLILARGACSTSGLSPDDWYPISAPASAARQEAAAAIAVCAGCPVRDECLELALNNPAVGRHGVWGGTVPAEREDLRTGYVGRHARIPARDLSAAS